MGRLSDDLRAMGFSPTDRESPFDESGMLWSNGYELVCDETATVIEKSARPSDNGATVREKYEYRNSKRVKLAGGHVSSYDWGPDEKNRFRY
jgi:hypothetical protein